MSDSRVMKKTPPPSTPPTRHEASRHADRRQRMADREASVHQPLLDLTNGRVIDERPPPPLPASGRAAAVLAITVRGGAVLVQQRRTAVRQRTVGRPWTPEECAS
jgi:hypothetical protein